MASRIGFGWFAFCVAACLTQYSGIARGQGVSVSPQGVKLQGFGDVDANATIEHWASEEQRRATEYLGLHIELLRDVCELSDDEVTKLQFAAKGVAVRRVNSGKQQLKRFMIESELIPHEDFESEPPAEADKLLISGAANNRDQPGLVVFQTQFAQSLLEHTLWQSVLKSTFPPQQFEAYEAFTRKRNLHFLATALASAVAHLDSQVCLSPEQRAKLIDNLQHELSRKVTLVFPSNLEQAGQMTLPIISDVEQLRPFLREDQVRRLVDVREAQNHRGVSWSSR